MTTLHHHDTLPDSCRPAIDVAEDLVRVFQQQRASHDMTNTLDELLTPSGTPQEYADRLWSRVCTLRKCADAERVALLHVLEKADAIEEMLTTLRDHGFEGETALCPCCDRLAVYARREANDYPGAPRAWAGWSCDCGAQWEVE